VISKRSDHIWIRITFPLDGRPKKQKGIRKVISIVLEETEGRYGIEWLAIPRTAWNTEALEGWQARGDCGGIDEDISMIGGDGRQTHYQIGHSTVACLLGRHWHDL